MIPTASRVIGDSGQTFATADAAEVPQSEFADTLQQFLAGTRRQDAGADSTVADPKASLTQRCKALAALINQRLAEGDNALDDDELQHLQALLAQLALQQWPADGDPVLAKLGIAPASWRHSGDDVALAHNDPRAAADEPAQPQPGADGRRKEATCSLAAAAPETAEAQGRQSRRPLLILPSDAKRNAKRAENPLPRVVTVNGQADAARTRVRDDTPLRTAPQSDRLAAAATPAPTVPTSTVLAAVTTDPASQPAQTPPPAPSAHLRQPLGSPAWQQQLGEQIMLFNRNGIFHAQLHLHPQELGAVKINLRLNQEQLQLHFASENQQVRAVLETAMTQLCTSLAENGIALGDTSVGAEAFGHDTAGQQQGHGESPQHGRTPSEPLWVAHRNGSVSVGSGTGYRGGIDIYA